MACENLNYSSCYTNNKGFDCICTDIQTNINRLLFWLTSFLMARGTRSASVKSGNISMLKTDEFQLGPGTIMYKGVSLGASSGPITILKETTVHEVFCDALAVEPKYSIVTGIKMEISMTLAEVDSGMDLFLDTNGQLDRSVIGTDLRSSAGELIITINENGKEVSYKFPNAIISPDYKFSADDKGKNIMDVVFSGGSNSSTYMQKINTP